MLFSSRQASASCFLASVVSFLASPMPAEANDSAAAMAAGGLELVKSEQIRMISEVLRIAPRLVEVNYVFENTSPVDVTTEVAFPLPDLDERKLGVSEVNLAFEGETNFVGFQVWSDGREIHPNVEVRAFDRDGREATADLKRLGIDPVKPVLEESRDGAALRRLHLAEFEGKDILPTWSTRVSFHWSQTFPAEKQVRVRHRYRPVYGAFFMSSASGDNRGLAEDGDKGRAWCPDAGFAAAERRLLAKQFEVARGVNPPAQKLTYYEDVQYVLKTGANWHGPIGRFELQVDRAVPSWSRPVRSPACLCSARLTGSTRWRPITRRPAISTYCSCRATSLASLAARNSQRHHRKRLLHRRNSRVETSKRLTKSAGGDRRFFQDD